MSHLSLFRAALLPVLLLLAPLAHSAPQEGVEPLSEERVLALAEEARVAVAAHFDMKPEEFEVPVRVVGIAELTESLEKDLEPQLKVLSGGEVTPEQLQQAASATAVVLYARYSYWSDEIMVCPRNFVRMAGLGDPLLGSEGVMRAALVHEFVHVHDGRRHGLGRCFHTLSTADALQGLSALAEGHAQYAARRVCAANGWTESFERLTASIGNPASLSEDELAAMSDAVVNAQIRFYYSDGERFVTEVVAERGEGAVESLFQSPPADAVVILEPRWYLDPASRPVSDLDPDAALDRFAELAIGEEFQAQRMTLHSKQLRAALIGMSEDRIERFLATTQQIEAQLGWSKEVTGRMRHGILFEFGTAGEALEGVHFERALIEYKDELMREGAVRVVRAEYRDLTLPGGLRGFLADRTLATGELEIPSRTVVLARGPAMIELLSHADEISNEELVDWAVAVLAAAHGEAPEPDEQPEEQPEEPQPEEKAAEAVGAAGA